jgi:hypothetical protein
MGASGRRKVEEEVDGSFTFRFTFTCGFKDDRPRKGKRIRKREILEWSKIP